ncbi:MAG TPA: DUF3473 domain-containing protein [Candidatus Latescibacteria bacterium]|nr:MAG: Peptidoglycan deacetylase [Candidatus Latescibacteria bacterium ADurb.Bin168]HPU84429.1 DUF3473 domain-containing protein [Candidatus Latescibacterota bacterium]
MTSEKPVNAFTVDVEDWFHVSAFRNHIGRDDWGRCELRVEANTERLLEILANHNVRGTFFVLGWVAERVPALVQRIACAGHEIACHGYHHELIYDCSPAQFEELTRRAVGVLGELLGKAPTGYRAASFSFPRSDRQWVYDILGRQGIRYDSSIFPIRRKFYGHPDAPWIPFDVTTPSGTLREHPLPVVKIAGQAFPFGGGGYFRLYPYPLTASFFRRANREGRPVVFYVHPWEIDPDQPRQNVGLVTKFRHYVNIRREEERLHRLLREFRFEPLPVGAAE